jgi:hypothetical protein
MTITYTNRKGATYYLCRGTTATGKLRYYFARQVQDEPVAEVPAGFKITESVNGVVSLTKDRPGHILPDEVACVEAAIARLARARNYRVVVRDKRIEVYERAGPDAEEIIAGLAHELLPEPGVTARLQDRLDQHAWFNPVLRFVLSDPDRRMFRLQRRCYLGSMGDWIEVWSVGLSSLDELVRRAVPCLGNDRFFELY